MMKNFLLCAIFSLCTGKIAAQDAIKRDSLLAVTDTAKDIENKTQAYCYLARIYERKNNDSLEFFIKKALQISLTSTNKITYLETASLAANLYASIGLVKKSIDISFDQLAVANSAKNYLYVSNAYSTIAYTYYKLRIFDNAKYYFLKSLQLVDEKKDTNQFSIQSLYSNIGSLYMDIKKFDSALLYINKSLATSTVNMPTRFLNVPALSDKLLVCEALNNAACIRETLSNLKSKISNGRHHYAWCVIFLVEAKMANSQGSYTLAKQLADSALNRATLSRTPVKIIEANNMLFTIHQNLGLYKLAANNKQVAYALADSLNQAYLQQQAVYAAELYESNSKENQILLLASKNKQQQIIQWLISIALLLAIVAAIFAYRSYNSKKKSAEILAQSNKEKEVFLKEIHHRVKNNLQIISSLLYMQFKHNKDPHTLAQLKQARERIKSMALVHNKLYESNDVVHVYLQDYITDLATSILQANIPSSKQINLHINASDKLNLSLDTSISVGLILNELITNSCKYAFENKQSGNINISVTYKDEIYYLTVQDDGIGLPRNFEEKNSLGLRLVKSLAGQLFGSSNFISNNGTLVEINFKDDIAA